MGTSEFASIIVALIACIAAIASQRAASRASTINTRIDAEKDAYVRARTMDIETIQRQDKEIEELRKENKTLTSRLRVCEFKVNRLEAFGYGPIIGGKDVGE